MQDLNNILTKARIVAAADGSAEVQDLYQQVEEAVEAGKSMTSALHYNALLEAAGADDDDVEQVASELAEQPMGYGDDFKPRKKKRGMKHHGMKEQSDDELFEQPMGYGGDFKPRKKKFPGGVGDPFDPEILFFDPFEPPKPSPTFEPMSGPITWPWESLEEQGGVVFDTHQWSVPGGGTISIRPFVGVGGGGPSTISGIRTTTVQGPFGNEIEIDVPFEDPIDVSPGFVGGVALHGEWKLWG